MKDGASPPVTILKKDGRLWFPDDQRPAFDAGGALGRVIFVRPAAYDREAADLFPSDVYPEPVPAAAAEEVTEAELSALVDDLDRGEDRYGLLPCKTCRGYHPASDECFPPGHGGGRRRRGF